MITKNKILNRSKNQPIFFTILLISLSLLVNKSFSSEIETESTINFEQINPSALSPESPNDTSQYGTEIAFFDKSEVLLMENAGTEQDTSTHRNTITIRETQSQDFFLVCLKLIDYDIDLKIDVYNLVAKKVQHVYDGPAVKSEDCPDKYKIEAYNLPNGMYICIVQGKNLKLSGKFVISR
jgi:hypothetical protein